MAASATASNGPVDPNSVSGILETLNYGPAPEAENVAQVSCKSCIDNSTAWIGPMYNIIGNTQPITHTPIASTSK